mgnify:CR=1 FL=1
MSTVIKHVFVEFPRPMTHNNEHVNAKGPIRRIEIMHKKEVVDGNSFVTTIYWADDTMGGEGGMDAFYSLVDLCKCFEFNLDEIINMVARAFIEQVGTPC